jgi:RNA polymerase sigma-70 factor (ECF subfamily)
MNSGEYDLDLVRKVQKGDKHAFDLLVLKYQQRIINLTFRFVKNWDDAADVSQDAFIKAYKGLANFRGDSAFYTWLYRIAANTAKNHLVSAKRKSTTNALDAQEAEQYDGADLLRENASPERAALTEELKKVIHDAIEALPTDLKEAVTLREFDGLSYDEIAEIMDCPIGTVRSRIFRARDAIDEKIKPLIDFTGIR